MFNQHLIRYPYCEVAYWKTNEKGIQVASGSDEDWTECKVLPRGAISSYGCFTFTRVQEPQRDALIYLLQAAFSEGQDAAKAEIRKVLGIPGC